MEEQQHNISDNLSLLRFIRFIFFFPIILFGFAYLLNIFIQPFHLAFFSVLLTVTFMLLGSQLLFEKVMTPYIEKLEELGAKGLYEDFVKEQKSLPGNEERALQLVSQVILQKKQTFLRAFSPYFPILLGLWLSFNWPQERGFFYLVANWVLFSALAWPFYLEREEVFERVKTELNQSNSKT